MAAQQKRREPQHHTSKGSLYCSDPACFYCRELRKIYNKHAKAVGNDTVARFPNPEPLREKNG